MSITTNRKSEENSQSHLISYRGHRFHKKLNIASPLTPTLVKAHTYCTSLTWPSLLESSRSQRWKREKVLWAKISYHWPLLQSLPSAPLPSQKTWAALGSLSHPTTCSLTQQSCSSDHESRLAFPFVANFRNSFLKQMYPWQNITWDKLLNRGSQPFYPKTPSLRARLKLWDKISTENHDMPLHKLGQEAVPKYASPAWPWLYW